MSEEEQNGVQGCLRGIQENKWFHIIKLADDEDSPGLTIPQVEHFGIPDDLTGKSVLDVGCAEGYCSFLAEERGAERVLGIDVEVERIERFRYAAERLGSKCEAMQRSAYNVYAKDLGAFDVVFFFGIWYHLRHPLWALERLYHVLNPGGLLLAESERLDDVEGPVAHLCANGFRGDTSTFWIPTLECLMASLKVVGFGNVEEVGRYRHRIAVRGHRPK